MLPRDDRKKRRQRLAKAGKALLRSKTFWVNALAIGAVAGGFFVPGLGPALAGVNILLRLLTKQPITSIK